MLGNNNLSLTQDWTLIFHHNLVDGIFPSNYSAGFSQRRHRYSVLSRVNDNFKIDGYFEFILYYPDIEEYCQWKQNVNPMVAPCGSDIGFEPVNCTWDNFVPDPENNFTGLRLSPSEFTLLDGINDGRWHYAIGITKLDTPKYYGMPGPIWYYKNVTINESYLYMRVNNPLLLPQLFSICTVYGQSITYSRFYYASVLITLHYSHY